MHIAEAVTIASCGRQHAETASFCLHGRGAGPNCAQCQQDTMNLAHYQHAYADFIKHDEVALSGRCPRQRRARHLNKRQAQRRREERQQPAPSWSARPSFKCTSRATKK